MKRKSGVPTFALFKCEQGKENVAFRAGAYVDVREQGETQV